MLKTQMELTLLVGRPSKPAPTAAHHQRLLAQWWFRQMRHAVDGVAGVSPSPTPQPLAAP
jgi:hypothetical protein